MTTVVFICATACGTGPGPSPAEPLPATSAAVPMSLPEAAIAGPAATIAAGRALPLSRSASRPTEWTGPVLPASPPTYLSVPAIAIRSPLITLGLSPDGSIQVPSLDDPNSRPGWYEDSPTPGAIGPAVLLGHVDSRRFGPGVFYALHDLRPGDAVEVTREDGTIAIFTVDDVRIVPKNDFPTLQVYGNLNYAGLRLITCGGKFDPDARSYDSNVIVYASLIGSRSE